MAYEVFFAGVGGTLLGTLVGAWISCRMTYDFQKRLLQQQLDFQKQQAEADAAMRQKIHTEMLAAVKDMRDVICIRAGQIAGRLPG